MSAACSSPPRIAIIGTCQAAGLAAATRAMLPDAEVAAWHVGVHPPDSEAEIAAKLRGFSLVISQIGDGRVNSPLTPAALRAAGVTVLFQPAFVFTGFHPDITYITTPAGLFRGADSDYHSVIALAGFCLGLGVPRVCRLFNALICAELGYLDAYAAAQRELTASFARAGSDIAPLFAGWLAGGQPFMHTINHPHIRVLASLAQAALVQAGLVGPATAAPAGLADGLAQNFVWPVYPAIARQVGVAGAMTFLRRSQGAGGAREMPLETFVERSFALYRAAGEARLRIPVVEAAITRLRGLLS